LIPGNSGWNLVVAYDINDSGQIVGWGYHNGLKRAFLLTPTEKVADLSVTAMRYQVPADKRGTRNGPWPVNEQLDVTTTVANFGRGELPGAFRVSFYLSTDATIDTKADQLVAAAFIAPIAPGATYEFTFALNEKRSRNYVPRQFNSRVWLGVVVDPDDEVLEMDENNNSASVAAVLFDEVLPWRNLNQTFASEAEAERHLERYGFSRAINPPGLTLDVGWSKPLAQSTFSRRFGEWKDSEAFRVHAGIALESGTWIIAVQGLDINGQPVQSLDTPVAIGEPSPRWLFWGVELLPPNGYVYLYHDHF
jgi:hypothetical protein